MTTVDVLDDVVLDAGALIPARRRALQEAFNGHFVEHHAFLLTRMLGRIDAITADIAVTFDDRLGDPPKDHTRRAWRADHFTRRVNSETKKRNHIRQLEALGYNVTVSPAA